VFSNRRQDRGQHGTGYYQMGDLKESMIKDVKGRGRETEGVRFLRKNGAEPAPHFLPILGSLALTRILGDLPCRRCV